MLKFSKVYIIQYIQVDWSIIENKCYSNTFIMGFHKSVVILVNFQKTIQCLCNASYKFVLKIKYNIEAKYLQPDHLNPNPIKHTNIFFTMAISNKAVNRLCSDKRSKACCSS